jgi:Tfp pilus assembly protein PilN
MRAINLLPARQEEAAHGGRWGDGRRRALAAGGAVLLVACGLAVVRESMSGTVDSRRRELGRLQAQLALARHASVAPPVKAPRADVDQRHTLVVAAAGKRTNWDRLLRELALVLPSDVWLSDLKAQVAGSADTSGSSSSGTAGSSGDSGTAGFTIEGSTYSQDAVARLLSRLQLIPDLVDVRLERSGSAQDTGVTAAHSVEFTITAAVRSTGSGS